MKLSCSKILILFFLLLSGCGSEGKDGNPYLAYTWVFTPYNWNDSNADIPFTVIRDYYYKTHEGTYSFIYSSNGYTYFGSYRITTNKGSDGSFPLKNGEDGSDSYFKLGLWSTGPSFYNFGMNPYSTNSSEDHPEHYFSISDITKITKEVYSNIPPPSFLEDNEDVFIEEFNTRKYKIILKYNRAKEYN